MNDNINLSSNSTVFEVEHGNYRTEQCLIIFALCVTVIGNAILTFVTIKLKKSKEIDFPDMKQHFMVLKIAYSSFNVLGSLLVYPLWLHIYHTASKGQYREITRNNCKVAVFFTLFMLSNSLYLLVALSVDRCLNWIFPFRYLLYKRRKKSKIPLTIVLCLTCIAATCSSIAAYDAGKANKVQRKSGILCALDVTAINAAVIIGYLCLLILVGALTMFVINFFKTRSERNLIRKHRGGGKVFPRLPTGVSVLLSLTLTGILFWTPFLVTATVAQFYGVEYITILVVFSLLFVPPLIAPFVNYVIFDDVRDKFHDLLKSAFTFLATRKKLISNVYSGNVNNINSSSC